MVLNVLYIPAAAETPLVEIYVSANGSDTAAGTTSAPASLTRARTLVIRNKKEGKKVNVHLGEGTYFLSTSIKFDGDYTGTVDYPVSFIAEGEVVFTTAKSIPFSGLEKITDDDIKDAVKPSVRNKLYKVDLTQYDITAGDIPEYKGRLVGGDGYDDVSVFVDSSELPVAQYPNGEGNYHKWVERIDELSFSVEEKTASNWESEKYGYFEGYPGYEYSCERNNITVADGIVTFRYKPTSGMRDKGSDRYKVKHVLYELDVPGEWYIDRETNVLYIYPTEEVKEKGISVAANKIPAMTFNAKAQYLTFNGITFDRIRGNGVTGTGCSNITFKNCTFSNITNKAIYKSVGTNTPQYGSYLITSNFTGGATNILIDSNKFINVGSNAVEIYGGTRETLTDSNNVVSNNYIYNASSKTKYNPNIILRGFGGQILNNEIHGGNFHAINIGGNNQLIKGNEIYNMARETGDTGLIYQGKSFTMTGSEISYNYLHDYGQLDRLLSDVITGIYFDDRQSGMYVHHNILYPNAVNADGYGIQNNGGQYNRFEYNIIVDSAKPFALYSRLNANLDSGWVNGMTELMFATNVTEDVTLDGGTVVNGIDKSYTLYLEKYPHLANTGLTLKNPNETVKTLAEKYSAILEYGSLAEDITSGADLSAYRLLSVKIPAENKFIGNVSNVDPGYAEMQGIYENYGGEFTENSYELTADDFVDYENKKFMINSASPHYTVGMLNEDFDLNTIGIQTFEPERQKDFALTYPESNSNVSDIADVFFMWEKPVGADWYTVEIADNPQMENAKSYESYYNWLNVKDLDETVDKFYWRVTAENISMNAEEWQSEISCFNKGYEIAVKENTSAMCFFDIKSDFNVNMFCKEGEKHNNNPTIAKYCIDDVTSKIKRGYLDYRGIKYSFPNVTNGSNNAIYTNDASYTYTLKDTEKGYYDKINMVVSGFYPIKNYEIKFNYNDGSSTTDNVEVGKTNTTYYNTDASDEILWANSIKDTGEIVGENYMYAICADANEDKQLVSIEFNGGDLTDSFINKVSSPTSKSIFIFAVTGILNQDKQTITYNSTADSDLAVKVLLTGYSGDEFKAYIFDKTAKKNAMYQYFELDLPEEALEMKLKRCFVWSDLKDMKPLAEISGF